MSQPTIPSLLFAFATAALLLPIQAQTHKLTLHPGQRIASLEMSAAEYADWKSADGFSDDVKREDIVKELYNTFTDAFDFIFLVLDETNTPSAIDYSGKLIPVSNAATGLGLSPFNAAGAYGSGGKLKAVMALTKRTHIQNGPALHELMHAWGNFGIPTAAFDPTGPGCCGGAVDDFEPHWGFTGGNTKGQLGGFRQGSLQTAVGGNPNRYKVESFGQIANGGNTVPYSEMELYLMGMIPVAEVTPFDVFRGVSAFDPNTYEFTAATRVRYDAARIESELGKRSPASTLSQRSFRLLIVVISGAPLTEAEGSGLDADAERFGRIGDEGTEFYNFWEATGGRGTLETGNLNGTLKSAAIMPYREHRLSREPVPLAERDFDLCGRRMRPWAASASGTDPISFRLPAAN